MEQITKNVILPYQRYLALKTSYDKEHGITTQESQEEMPNKVNEIHDKLSDDIILKFIPSRLKNKAQRLLEFLHQLAGLTWDRHGAISINGAFLKNSNICDLIVHSINNGFQSLTPEGAKEFLQLLLNSHIPLSIIAKRHRNCLLGSGTPGIPTNPKVRKLEQEWVW